MASEGEAPRLRAWTPNHCKARPPGSGRPGTRFASGCPLSLWSQVCPLLPPTPTTLMHGKICVMITFSRQSAERFSQNSADREGRPQGETRSPLQPRGHPGARCVGSPAPTFDLVRGCGPHLGLTVFHQVLEGGDQVRLGDLRPHGFLELRSGKGVVVRGLDRRAGRTRPRSKSKAPQCVGWPFGRGQVLLFFEWELVLVERAGS